MRVVRRADNELVLQEKATFVWLFVGVFAIGGLYVLFQSGDWVIAGLLLLGCVAVLLFFAITVTCTFDLAAGRFVRDTKGLVRKSRLERSLSDIVGVRLERSPARMSQSWRVALVLSTDESVPLTSTYSSGKADKLETAEVIRSFLGLREVSDTPIPGFRELARMAFDSRAAQEMAQSYSGPVAEQEQAVHRDPDNVAALRELATALAMQGRVDEARTHLEHARDLLMRSGDTKTAAQYEEMLKRVDAAVRGR